MSIKKIALSTKQLASIHLQSLSVQVLYRTATVVASVLFLLNLLDPGLLACCCLCH